MSRYAASSHVIGSEQIRTIGRLRNSTSGQVTEKVGLHGSEDIFYLKHSDSNETAQIEALALYFSGLTLDNIFLVSSAEGKLSLLTKDNQFFASHDLFTDKKYSETLKQLFQKDPNVFAPSFAAVCAGILFLGDDDPHARNIGVGPNLDEVLHIDLDRIRFLISKRYKGPRGPANLLDCSDSECFRLSADLLDNYIMKGTIDRRPLPLPHFHPLASSPYLARACNRYDDKAHEFFQRIYFSEKFNAAFVESLFDFATRSLESLEEAAIALGIDVKTQDGLFCSFKSWIETRQFQLQEALVSSTHAKTYLAREQLQQLHLSQIEEVDLSASCISIESTLSKSPPQDPTKSVFGFPDACDFPLELLQRDRSDSEASALSGSLFCRDRRSRGRLDSGCESTQPDEGASADGDFVLVHAHDADGADGAKTDTRLRTDSTASNGSLLLRLARLAGSTLSINSTDSGADMTSSGPHAP